MGHSYQDSGIANPGSFTLTDDTSPSPPRTFRLSEVTKRLRDVLLPVTAKRFWVRAQVVPENTRATGGHVYGQLVESDDSGRDVARMRVTIWKSDYERIEQALRARGVDRLDKSETPMDELGPDVREAAQLITEMRTTLTATQADVARVFAEMEEQTPFCE